MSVTTCRQCQELLGPVEFAHNVTICEACERVANTPPMTCADCGVDLREGGIQDVQSVIATSTMRYSPDAKGWDYTGDSEAYFDCCDHIRYCCRACGGDLTPDQLAVIVSEIEVSGL